MKNEDVVEIIQIPYIFLCKISLYSCPLIIPGLYILTLRDAPESEEEEEKDNMEQQRLQRRSLQKT